MYDLEKARTICERLAEEPALGLREILRQEGVPKSTFHDWRNASKEVEDLYQAAKSQGFDNLAHECLEIADNPREGVTEKYEPITIPNPDGPELPQVTKFQLTERKTEDMLGHRRLQIETRLKLLAKWDPKRYGEKMDHTHGGAIGFSLNVRRRKDLDKDAES